jgi:hypothetical protein
VRKHIHIWLSGTTLQISVLSGMGCTTSKRVKVRKSMTEQSLVQEESQSFRCNVKAVRYALKDAAVRQKFQVYLSEQKTGVEFLSCYMELECMKLHRDDKLIPALNLLLAKYQVLYDQSLHANTYVTQAPGATTRAIWNKLRRLHTLNVTNITRNNFIRALTEAQNQMLSELAVPFEEFLESAESSGRQEKPFSSVNEESYNKCRTPTRLSSKGLNVSTSASMDTATPPIPRKLTPKAASQSRQVSPFSFNVSDLTRRTNSDEFSRLF